MSRKKAISGLLVFIISFLLLCCSKNKEQIFLDSKNKQILSPPTITFLANLPDSIKPKHIFLDQNPEPLIGIIPSNKKDNFNFKTGNKIIKLKAPELTIFQPKKTFPTQQIEINTGKKKQLPPIKNSIAPETLGKGFFTNYTADNGLTIDGVSCAIMDKKGNIWFGTAGGGISKYDGKSFTNYTTLHGLSNNLVFCLTEDKKGNIWIGTDGGGVCRYDGVSFVNFTAVQGLPNNSVSSIIEDKKGKMWFGTLYAGISCYDGRSFINYSTKEGLVDKKIRSIKEDKLGNLWIGTENGLSRFDGKKFTNFNTKDGLPNKVISCIQEDKKGNIWFGTFGGGVSCYDGKYFTNFNTEQGLAKNLVLCITEDNKGNIWFGTHGGVSRYDGKSFANFDMDQGFTSNRVWSITTDQTGNLWFGTEGSGVYRYDGDSFTNYTTVKGLVNGVIFSISEDKQGNIWFCSQESGISCYYERSEKIKNNNNSLSYGEAGFINYMTSPTYDGNAIFSSMEDKTSKIWFGTRAHGVFCYNGNIIENIEKEEGINKKSTKKINQKSGKSFINYTKKQGLIHNSIWNITEDKLGNIWFGTSSGVSKYDGNRIDALERKEFFYTDTTGLKKINGKFCKSFTNYSTDQGLAGNFIWCSTKDKNGNIWFGTKGKGVSFYDGKSFKNYTTKHGLPDNSIFCIEEDKAGNIWFGTEGGGLSRFDGKSFTNFNVSDGLPNNTVTEILIDSKKNNNELESEIFIGTNTGIAVLSSFIQKKTQDKIIGVDELKDEKKISPQNTLNNEQLKNYLPSFEVYNSTTGYPIKDVNVGHNTIFKDSKGIIWIATGSEKTGLVRMNYKKINKNFNPPKVYIQSLKINNENICWYDLNSKLEIQNLKLDSNAIQPNITEEGLIFGRVLTEAQRDTMRLKYSGIKFDSISPFYPIPKNLILPYEHNSVTFDFVAIEPARHYLIKYQYILEGYDKTWSPITNKTSANFGNIPEGNYTFKLKACNPFGIWSKPIIYNFKVLSPWHRTWWAYSIYSIIAISILIGIYRLRTASLRKDKEILAQTVKERTAEVVLQKEEAEKQKNLVEKKNNEITNSITYALRIQESMLPSQNEINFSLPKSFILYKPKDIVSGDFYWYKTVEYTNTESSLIVSEQIIVVADCTGHGVPGAFLSMIGSTLLNDIVTHKKITDPARIIKELAVGVSSTFSSKEKYNFSTDGMDISVCKINQNTQKLYFAGANQSIYLINNKGLQQIDSQIKSVTGIFEISKSEKFETIEINLEPDTSIYISTDGYYDQMGGKIKKRFTTTRFKELLSKIYSLPHEQQKLELEKKFTEWSEGYNQIDDILIIGIKI